MACEWTSCVFGRGNLRFSFRGKRPLIMQVFCAAGRAKTLDSQRPFSPEGKSQNSTRGNAWIPLARHGRHPERPANQKGDSAKSYPYANKESGKINASG